MTPQGTIAHVYIDGTEVRALEGSVTKRLSGIGTATCRVPITEAIGGAGSYLKVYLESDDLGTTPVLWHHGRVLTCEDTADENSGYTVYNSSDPLELWSWRPVRDLNPLDPGDFTSPTIVNDYVTGPQIIEAMLQATWNNTAGVGIGDDDTEGPHRLLMGVFETGGVDLSGTPTDWPMTMADLAGLLVSTGEVDIVITPIEFTDDAPSGQTDCYGQIDVYNGDYGFDLQSSVRFSYGMNAHNIRSFRRNEDMSRLVNKLWYYLGPRIDQQHWQANITATQDFTIDFPGNPYAEEDPSPCPYDAASPDPYDVDVDAIRTRLLDSRGETSLIGAATNTFDPSLAGSFDVRMEVRTYDDRNDEARLGYCLFKKLWLIESYLRALPLELVHITPTRDTAIGSFDIGDLVYVEATSAIRGGGFAGAQRVYEYTVNWDQDSVPAIQELQVSSDNEGFR